MVNPGDIAGVCRRRRVCLLLNVSATSQRWICSDNLTCCHTEIEVADPTCHLIQSCFTDIGPTSPRTDPITSGAWQGSHWSTNFKSLVWLDPRKISAQVGFEPGIFRSWGGRLNHYANEAVEEEEKKHIPKLVQRLLGWVCCYKLSREQPRKS